jgi:RES domain-containing protein
MTKKKDPTKIILDQISVGTIREFEKNKNIQFNYQLEFFYDLQTKRLLNYDKLKSAIAENSKPYKKNTLWRIVRSKWQDTPLSTIGSTKHIGGRFNYGDGINPEQFQKFNALYLGESIETAFFEAFQITKKDYDSGKTKRLEFESQKISSYSCLKIECNLTNVLRVKSKNFLKEFYKEVKKIKTSEDVKNMWRENKEILNKPNTTKSSTELLGTILDPNWRSTPMLYDIPANSQVLGSIASHAGVEGILYPSTKGKEKCLVVFPRNLGEGSFIKLVDEASDSVKVTEINSQNYKSIL